MYVYDMNLKNKQNNTPLGTPVFSFQDEHN